MTGPRRRSVLCAEVSNLLRRERRLLQQLATTRAEHRARADHPTGRVIPPDPHVVEALVSELRWIELERAVVAQALAGELGLPGSPGLAELASEAPPPWNEVFEDHRGALVELVHLIDRGAGGRDHLALPESLVDLRLQEVLHPSARRNGGFASRPSLVDFLGETA